MLELSPRALMQATGVAAGFALQSLAMCCGLVILLARWPQVLGAIQWLGVGCLVYLGWQTLRARRPGARGARGSVKFWEAAAHQFLNPTAWLMSLATVLLLLPGELARVLASGYTATI
jgi:threonine/homoserine/homoserine lactone efflux protein